MSEVKERVDIMGIPLEIGDIVAYADMQGQSAVLRTGIITGFTPQFAKLIDYGETKWGAGRKSFDRIIRINDQITFNRENYPELLI